MTSDYDVFPPDYDHFINLLSEEMITQVLSQFTHRISRRVYVVLFVGVMSEFDPNDLGNVL